MSEFVFSSNQVTNSEQYYFPASLEALEMTPNLKRCSLTNAMRFGGPLVRLILETAPLEGCLLYTSPSPRDGLLSRMPSSA